MSPADLLAPAVAAVAPNARVVLKLADGTDLDIKRVEHFCGLVVLTPDEPVTTDFVSDHLLSFETILEEYKGLTPDELRRVIEATDFEIEDVIKILEKCTDFEIEDVIKILEKCTDFEIEDVIKILEKCTELELHSATELEDRISE